MLDYRIYTFLAVCETMNFTRAAERAGITQPGVTQHIHYLEKYYGAKLFRLNGKKPELTSAGRLLYSAACTMQSDEKLLMKQMHLPEEKQQPVCMGATITIGEFVLAKMLAHYQKKDPGQIISISIANTSELLQKLKSGEIQFALVEGYFNKNNYGCRLFRTERFIPAVSASHRFAKKPVKLKDLLNERLLLREMGSGTREILERSLAAENYTLSDFPVKTVVNSIYTIIQLLKEDAGITFLYEAAVRREIEEGTIVKIPLKDFSVFHDFTFIWDKKSLFADTYRKICDEMADSYIDKNSDQSKVRFQKSKGSDKAL
jgi:DNA-binding transcriptional LysR family regulator